MTQGTWHGHAFGVEVESPIPLSFLGQSGGVSGKQATLELVPPDQLERGWRAAGATVVVDWRFLDGRPMLSVERHETAGYRIWSPGFGRYVVASDGRWIRAALPRGTWKWQRLFLAQVLPLASTLQGFDLFHASAVELEGRTLAFVAAAGSGKTSVAAHLVAEGASLITDDVLALESLSGRVVAHPGPRLANVDPTEVRAMTPAGRRRLGDVVGRSGKLHFAVAVTPRRTPLGALYYLRRGGGAAALEIKEDDASATQSLLASSFLAYVRSPERLRTHLDVCADVSRYARTFHVTIPASVSAREVASRIRNHARALGPEGKGRRGA